jgi:hypothetical protein
MAKPACIKNTIAPVITTHMVLITSGFIASVAIADEGDKKMMPESIKMRGVEILRIFTSSYVFIYINQSMIHATFKVVFMWLSMITYTAGIGNDVNSPKPVSYR